MSQRQMRMGGREWALLLFLSLLWGGSFFFIKVLVAAFPPLTVALGRVGLAALALNLFLAARRDPLPALGQLWGGFLVLGLLNNVVPFTLIAFGETRIASGLASILNATTPIFTVLAAHALTANEKLTWAKGIGVVFGFLGVAVLIGPGVLSCFGHGGLAGEMACILAGVSYALAGIYGRRFRGVPALKLATGQITASTLLLLPVTAMVDRPWTLPWPSPAAWGAWIAIALVSTALAYLVYFRILAVAGATNVLLVTFLVPVSALMLGAVFLDEAISAQSLGGMALIGLGLSAIDGRLWAAVLTRGRVRVSAGAD